MGISVEIDMTTSSLHIQGSEASSLKRKLSQDPQHPSFDVQKWIPRVKDRIYKVVICIKTPPSPNLDAFGSLPNRPRLKGYRQGTAFFITPCGLMITSEHILPPFPVDHIVVASIKAQLQIPVAEGTLIEQT